jgi:flagellar protein FlaG
MNVDTISSTGGLLQQQPRATELIDAGRKNRETAKPEPQAAPENPKIQPEELLDQIKTVTQDGLYSVRFERGDASSELVVKIFDNETQEVVRQIPAEELLNFKATFEELIGNLVNTRG